MHGKNNPFLKQGKSPFVSVGREMGSDIMSNNEFIAMSLKEAFLNATQQHKKNNFQDLDTVFRNINSDNIDEYVKTTREYLGPLLERRKDIIDNEIIQEIEKTTENEKRAKETKTPWYENNGKNQRSISIKQHQGSMTIIEVSSEIEGLKRYTLQYKNKEGKLEKIKTIYSEGINFDLMIENDEYYLAVKEDLLNEKRLEQREKESKSYGIMPGIAYVGTIDGNEQGKLVKTRQMDSKKLKQIYSELSNKNQENENHDVERNRKGVEK